jgi:hypothetical protein
MHSNSLFPAPSHHHCRAVPYCLARNVFELLTVAHLNCSRHWAGRGGMRRVSMATRDELITAVSRRYSDAERIERSRILDEFVAVTGYHRKHAMRVLRSGRTSSRNVLRSGRRIYGEAVREALILLWEASDRVCGKRLKALLPVLIAAMERHGRLALDPLVRTGVVAMSAAGTGAGTALCVSAVVCELLSTLVQAIGEAS